MSTDQISKPDSPEEDINEKNIQLVVFKLVGEEYALPIEQIKEVVLTPKISKIPQTPDYIKGVANIRGNVISILDLELKFGLSSKTNSQTGDVAENLSGNYTLVIESEAYKIGILVKEVPNTLTVGESNIDSSANIIQYSTFDENAISGVVKIDDRMIILTDVVKMMESGEIKTQL